MTNQSALEIVSAYQDAWTHKDFDTAARYLAEDIVFHSSGQHLARIGEFLTMLTAFAIHNGKIQSETLVFDPKPFSARPSTAAG